MYEYPKELAKCSEKSYLCITVHRSLLLSDNLLKWLTIPGVPSIMFPDKFDDRDIKERTKER